MEDSFDIALPNQLADEELSTYKKELPTLTVSFFPSRLKSTIAKKHRVLQMFLLVLALVGACMCYNSYPFSIFSCFGPGSWYAGQGSRFMNALLSSDFSG